MLFLESVNLINKEDDYFLIGPIQNKKIVNFTTSDNCSDIIDMVFNKKRANDRKKWLSIYDRNAYLNTSKKSVTYEEFIDNDLRHFSKYDNDLSIPNLADALKISL